MADTGVQVGSGVFIITVVWISALGLGGVLMRTAGSVRLWLIPVVLLALSVTLALVFFPRSSETLSSFKEIQIVDSLFIGRYVLLAVAALVFLLAFFMLLPVHFLEPVSAKTLKTF